MNPTLLIGKIIRNFAPSYAAAPDLSELVDGVLPGRTKSQTLQLTQEQHTHGGRQFRGPALSWTYDFLEYIPGFVTVAPLDGPLLTGPMSGCFLCKYTVGGKVHIAHVGTDVASEKRTEDVKKQWKAFADRTAVSEISGANPMAVVNVAPQAVAAVGGVAPLTFGYFDAEGNGYAIVFTGVASAAGPRALPGVKLISHVLPMTLTPWAALKSHPKFT